jgi:type I restriction enzyme S subunit
MNDSWTPVHLEDIFTPGRGISYSANDLKDADGTGSPFITIKNFNKGGGFNHKGLKTYSGPDFPLHRLEPEALLIANTDVTRDAEIIGAPLLVPALDDRPLFSMDVNQLTPTGKLGYVDPRYIFFRLCIADARSHMQKVSAGSTVLHLHVKDALKFRFDLPPVSEQTKIAQILDTLDTQIQKTEALIEKLEKIKEGLLHDLLTRGTNQNGQLRPTPEQAPELYKESALGFIPKEWEVRQLGSMAIIVSGVTLGGQLPSSSWPLVAYLRVANVQDGYLDLKEVKFLRVKPADVEKFRLVPGDVLMNEGGDFDKLGRGTVWEGQIEQCIHQNHVFRVRTFPNMLDPYFLAYFSGSSMGKSYFVKSSKQSTNLASINSTQLKAFHVPVPTFSEQMSIINRLKSHKKRLDMEIRNLEKLRAQKTGLMDDLLSGHVRVTTLLKDAV